VRSRNPKGGAWCGSLARAVTGVALLALGTSFGFAPKDTPKDASVAASVPASRQADRVAVITIEGAIDRVTAMSVRRRIREAEDGGYDAMVFEIDSPGGGVGAVLEITGLIKASSIVNTLAWVNPDAYSGGAIIALACREIVSSSPAAMGDAFPVIPTLIGSGSRQRSGLRGLTPDERTKLLPPLLADVTDSARRNGYDESLVQAIVIDGIELWMVEDTETGRRHAINEDEYRALFGQDPPRGMPMIPTVTGGRPTAGTPSASPETESDPIPETDPGPGTDPSPETDPSQETGPGPETRDGQGVERDPETAPEGDQAVPGAGAVDPGGREADDARGQGSAPSQGAEDRAGRGDGPDARDRRAFRPADDSLEDVAREFASPERVGELTIEPESTRPNFLRAEPGRFTPVGYITDGSAPIVMRDDQLVAMGFSSGIIRDDVALMAFFGANELDRADESWSESLVRIMTSLPVRGVLIVILIVAVFAEMVMGGTGIGAAVALGALGALIGPPMMIGLAGWWEVVAIGLGIVLLLIEAFVTPGFGVFGVLGFVSLFVGVMGTFVPSGSSLANPATQQDLLSAAVTLILALCTAGVVVWLISRQIEHIPILDHIILTGASGVTAQRGGGGGGGGVLSAMGTGEDTPRIGEEGTATTDLRPSGQAEIHGRLLDVVSGLGYIDQGERVRVVAVESIRVVVERVEGAGEGGG